jgi:hypothetical protein
MFGLLMFGRQRVGWDGMHLSPRMCWALGASSAAHLLLLWACADYAARRDGEHTGFAAAGLRPVMQARLLRATDKNAVAKSALGDGLWLAGLSLERRDISRPPDPVLSQIAPWGGLSSGHAQGALRAQDGTGVMLPASRYLPSSLLERKPVAVSSPDYGVLRSMTPSGEPIRLRLYIDEHGDVQSADVLRASSVDRDFAEQVRLMFLRTAFIPGLYQGRDVASFLDVEFAFLDESMTPGVQEPAPLR